VNTNPDEMARLEPAVKSAINLRGTRPAPKEDKKGKGTKKPGGDKECSYTLERYTADLMKDIEDNYIIGDDEGRLICRRLQTEYGQRYSMEDLAYAVKLANELTFAALITQSDYGDCEEAILDLEKKVPGFSRGLYQELIGYMAYINR
jgi:hypothetical protein